MNLFRTAVVLVALVCSPASLPAGTILQDDYYLAGVFTSQDGFKGQSFTAEDPWIQTIGVGLLVMNPSFAYDTTVRLSLYDGRGNTGPFLAARSVSPAGAATGTQVWADFDFSGIELVPGHTYTFVGLADTRFWAMEYNQWKLPGGGPIPGARDYSGGEKFIPSGFVPEQDLRFRVVPVPEPAVAWLTGVGFALVWSRRAARR